MDAKPGFYVPDIGFGNRRLYLHLGDVFGNDKKGWRAETCRDRLTHADITRHHHSVDGGIDAGVVQIFDRRIQLCLHAVHGCLGAFVLVLVIFVVRFGDGPGLKKGAFPVKGILRIDQGCFGDFQVGLVLIDGSLKKGFVHGRDQLMLRDFGVVVGIDRVDRP